MKKKLLILFSLPTLLLSCEKFSNESEFRNVIRDKHPYCILKTVSFVEYDWNYVAIDTIKNNIYLYSGDRYDYHSLRIDTLVWDTKNEKN